MCRCCYSGTREPIPLRTVCSLGALKWIRWWTEKSSEQKSGPTTRKQQTANEELDQAAIDKQHLRGLRNLATVLHHARGFLSGQSPRVATHAWKGRAHHGGSWSCRSVRDVPGVRGGFAMRGCFLPSGRMRRRAIVHSSSARAGECPMSPITSKFGVQSPLRFGTTS